MGIGFFKFLKELFNGTYFNHQDQDGYHDYASDNMFSDGSTSSPLGAIFNKQNWKNTVGPALLGDSYDNHNSDSVLSQLLGGTSFSALFSALTNRITAEHLTGAEQEANAFSAQQAQIDRDFQERMSNTQYQRGVADMRAAGINPALAMSNGGASAPSGSTAAGVQPQGQAFNFSDLMQLMMLKPQKELMRKQGDAAVINAEANREQAAAATRNAATTAAELSTVKQPLAANQIAVGKSVVSLNEKRMVKVDAEIAQLAEDTNLTMLHEIADALGIQYKLETWEDNKRMLSAQIAKTFADEVYSYAMSSKASEETRSAALANEWQKVVNDYWTDPANKDRGVNLEMLKGTNAAGATFAYLQALGDNLDENNGSLRAGAYASGRSVRFKGGSR